MNIVCVGIYGETCSGKTSLGKYLSGIFDCPYLSFGDIKRNEIAQGTEIGLRINTFVQRKIPIPPELGFKIMERCLSPGLNILSGYPISLPEYEIFSLCAKMIGVVVLHIDEETLRKRFENRHECPQCHFPGIKGNRCEIHGVLMVRRGDATPCELEARKDLFRARISPFLDSPVMGQLPRLTFESQELSLAEKRLCAREWLQTILFSHQKPWSELK